MGGPAHQVALLSGRRLDPERYETLLVHGELAPGEASAEHLAKQEGARLVPIPTLSPQISPLEDPRALASICGIAHRFRPHVVHTHTAKAGFLGRSAALASGGRRPKLVHTFHGHVLSGYFGPAKERLYRGLERGLGSKTDALVGVSDATVAELVEIGVAPAERFRTIPVGLDLPSLVERSRQPGLGPSTREELGLDPDAVVFTFVGRLVPIKRVDRLIEAFAIARAAEPTARLVVVGDGDERPEREAQARAAGVADAVRFAGYRSDLAGIFAASDCAVISSDNEGTPVSLIEAGACGVPGISVDVGGVREVLGEDAGIVVPRGDATALGKAMARVAGDADLRSALGRAAAKRMPARYGADRLLADIDALYGELVGAARS